jgi:hypothetical protein
VTWRIVATFWLIAPFFEGRGLFAGLFRTSLPGAVVVVFRDSRPDGIRTGSVWAAGGISLMGLVGRLGGGASSTRRRGRGRDLGALGDGAGRSSSSLDDDDCWVVGTELNRNALGTIIADHNRRTSMCVIRKKRKKDKMVTGSSQRR